MDETKKGILHELYLYYEWKPEPEFLQNNDITFTGDPQSFLHWLTLFGPERTLLECALQWKQSLQRWQIVLSDEGKVMAVLGDNILEIRTKRADYSTIVARTTVTRDAHPQLRKIIWSPDCSLLALGHSNGTVSFYDLTATNLFNISADCIQPPGQECKDTMHALSSIIFLPPRVSNDKWSWEVLLITYNGRLRSYSVSQLDGSRLNHKFTFDNGVSSALYCKPHELIYIAGTPTSTGKNKKSAVDYGLTAWRVLNDYPYYTLSVASDELTLMKPQSSILKYIPLIGCKKQDYILQMAVSPCSSKLVCLDTKGEVTIWRLPVLRLQHIWPLEEQPGLDDVNVQRMLSAPCYINWWNSDSIIISRFNGSISICNIEDMVNILGKKPEFLQGTPQITNTFDNSFLAFECDSKIISGKRDQEGQTESQSTELITPKNSIYLEMLKELIKTTLYAITDMERFQPKPKKITLISRVYRLLCIKSTTPLELYSRKIENGNFEEALSLADHYKLDSDLVYQQQWRKSPVSHESIQNYLAKVSKKTWSVHQCVDRLPETLEAAKELLQFGLDLTDQEILNDVKRLDPSIIALDALRPEHLNAHTSEVLRCRHLLLFYVQRLQLYEDIIMKEKSKFVHDEYQRLRSNSLVNSAIQYAKEGRIEALSCLCAQIAPISVLLTVLDNVPETIDPQKYKHLLPKSDAFCDKNSNINEGNDKDWCQNDIFKSIWNSNWSEDGSQKDQTQRVDIKYFKEWIEKRCETICSLSGLVQHALSLAQLANNLGVEDLDKLITNLETLQTLFYDVNYEGASLKLLESSSTLDICEMLMTQSTPDSFVEDLKQLVVPYLKKVANLNDNENCFFTMLTKYLAHLSINSLAPLLSLLKCSDEFVLDLKQHLDLIENCLMSYNGTNEVATAYALLETVSEERLMQGSMEHKQWNKICQIVSAWDILCAHNALTDNTNIAHLSQLNAERTLTHMARNIIIRIEKPHAKDWKILLSDMMSLCDIIFCDIEKEKCYEIYACAALTSSSVSGLEAACDVLSQTRSSKNVVSYEKSLSVALHASHEYYNSASSLDDPVLEHARTCLLLIKEDEKIVDEELQLIAALKILHEFGLSILPVQVRLCTDRISLIEDCLKSSPQAYMASHKLLELAKLLQISPDDENIREASVLSCVLQSALDACETQGGEAWSASASLASRLAQYSTHSHNLLTRAAVKLPHLNKNTRYRLLAAALLHTDNIREVLHYRLQIEAEELQKEILSGSLEDHELLKQCSADSTEEIFSDAITTPNTEAKSFFTPILDDKLNTLSSYISTKKWQSMGWLKGENIEESRPRTDMDAVYIEEFYHKLYKEYRVSSDSYQYNSFAPPDDNVSLSHPMMALRSMLLQQQLVNADVTHLLNQAGLACSNNITWSPLRVALMCRWYDSNICMSDGESVQVLEEGIVCVSHILLAALLRVNQDFYLNPAELLTKFFQKLKTDPNSININDKALIFNCIEKLKKSEHFKALSDKGILFNPAKFSNDMDYRHEVIRKLNSPEDVSVAIKLAGKELAPSIWMEYATQYLINTDTSKKTILTQQTQLLETLSVSHYLEEFKTSVWQKIKGTNHEGLIQFFSLLQNVDPSIIISTISVLQHVKLVKKVKATSLCLDYKLLFGSWNDLLQHLLIIVNADNIASIGKLLRVLPQTINITLNASQLYKEWLIKHFFSIPESAASVKKWMQQYRQCTSYYNKLSKEHLIQFMDAVIFSEEATSRVPVGTRCLMLLQIIEYCQLESDNEQNFIIKPGEISWHDMQNKFNKWMTFLEKYHSPSMQEIMSKHMQLHPFWSELESSKCEDPPLTDIFAKLIVNEELSINEIIKIESILHPMISLKNIILKILQDNNADQKLLERCALFCGSNNKEYWIEIVNLLLSLPELPKQCRITLLQYSQKNRRADSDDLPVLSQYSVEIIKENWKGNDLLNNVNEDIFYNVDDRERMLKKLVKEADSLEKKKSVVDLINCWAQHSDLNIILNIFLKQLVSDVQNHNESIFLLKLLLSRQTLSDKQMDSLIKEPMPCTTMIWLCLLSKSKKYIANISSLIKQTQQVDNMLCDVEDELIILLLENDCFIQLVPTKIYGKILNYIINNTKLIETKFNIDWAIDTLLESGMRAEAGQLKLMKLGIPFALKTYSSAILICKNSK